MDSAPMAISVVVHLFIAAMVLPFIGAFHLVHEITPLMPRQDFDSLPWARGTVKLERRGSLYLLHYYTCSAAEEAACRFTRREAIPHHKRIIRVRTGIDEHTHLLAERGFSANWEVPAAEALALPSNSNRYVTWNWNWDKQCGALIQFCFKHEVSTSALQEITQAAFDMWHAALEEDTADGEEKGVRLVLYGKRDAVGKLIEITCYESDGKTWRNDLSRDTVVIQLSKSETHYNTLGWMPRKKPGRMQIEFKPLIANEDDDAAQIRKRNVADMAHELGHVMGLEHEHQRYDAAFWIKLNPENMRDFQYLDGAIRAYNARAENAGSQLTKEEVLRSHQKARELHVSVGDTNAVLPLDQFLPFSREDIEGYGDFKTFGSVDWRSIMLNSSWAYSADGDRSKPTMLRSHRGATWEQNLEVSPGNVIAVKRIYPDVELGYDPSQG